MKTLYLFAAALLLSLPASAVDRITASISITNAPTTNGMTFVVNGGTRTWTNSVSNPSTQILTNATAAGSKTNLFNQISANPFLQVTLTDVGSTNFQLVAASGVAITVAPSAGYATVTYSTQTVTSLQDLRLPVSGEPSAAVRTNNASDVVAAINMTENTNAIAQISTAAGELVGKTNIQTITGQKTFSNTNGTWSGLIAGSQSISGNASSLTGGTYRASTLLSPAIDAGTATNLTLVNTNALGDWTFYAEPGSGDFVFKNAFDYHMVVPSINAIYGSVFLLYVTNLVSLDGNLVLTPESADDYVVAQDCRGFLGGFFGDGIGVTNVLHTVGSNDLVNADIAFARYANSSLANGNNAAVVIRTNVFMDVSGPSAAFTINGIAGGRDGKEIKIMNKTGQTMTIANDSGVDPTAANRIRTGTGSDVAYTNNPGIVSLIYDANVSRWVVESSNK
jgi:hypothetical protein